MWSLEAFYASLVNVAAEAEEGTDNVLREHGLDECVSCKYIGQAKDAGHTDHEPDPAQWDRLSG